MTRLPGLFYTCASLCMMESVTYCYFSWVRGARDVHDTAHVPFVFIEPMVWLVHVGRDPCGVRDTRHFILTALIHTGPNLQVPPKSRKYFNRCNRVCCAHSGEYLTERGFFWLNFIFFISESSRCCCSYNIT